MSYTGSELSEFSGAPYKLYKISIGDKSWCYTTSPIQKRAFFEDFIPASCMNSPIKSSSDTDKNDVTLTLEHTLPICQLLAARSPSTPAFLFIYEGHEGDPDLIKTWHGRMVNFNFKPPVCELTTESVLTAMRRMAAALVISSRCSVPLYGPVCRVNPAAFVAIAGVTAVAGRNISVTGANLSPNWYAGGYITWTDPLYDIENSRDVESSAGGVLTLVTPAQGLEPGMTIKAFPGCNHAWAGDCRTKFNNTINCPAFIGMNGRNPFAGYSVY